MHRRTQNFAVLRTVAVIGAVALTVGVVARGTSGATLLGAGQPGVGLPGAVALQAAPAAMTWAPASTATVHPGVETLTEGAQCTANFVFSDGTTVYIGQAAHCAGTGGDTQTDGCSSPTLPAGTPVTISGATHPGTIVYSSWATMQALHETDANTCAYNDLALVKVDPADVGEVNPTIPVWGGPEAVNSGGTAVGDRVFSYGNSILRLGVTLVSPKEGISEGDTGGGWSTSVVTVSPGIPGDSGSAFLDANGNALGILSTLGVSVPGGVTNNIGNVALELAYMHAHSSFTGVQLVPGTSAFNADAVPLDTNQPVDPNAPQNLQNFFG